tara:strand:- start:1423 stop:1644 length:222 start_codon:yes stop_codon:yes gene_type:complete
MQSVIIHCKPSVLDYVKEMNLTWNYSPRFGVNEIDVIVPDVEYSLDHGLSDPDQQLVHHYGIDYEQVNCIELA